MWRMALICAAAVLAGCNIVTSTTPMFTAADARGQVQLRPGLWMTEKADCVFDTRLPLASWPDCTDSWVIRPGAIVGGRESGAPPSSWKVYRTVVARNDPPVLQVALDGGPGESQLYYVYAGLKPLKLDDRGRIVEYRYWLALCGPPPASDPTGDASQTVTAHPIDGLVIDKENHDCIASAPGPVRVSARESEAWTDADELCRDRARWVRDGEN